ncbi:LysR family transcriptional regulator [Azospirillum rugosum]|uniref:DNA-binding transcriptional LysR family regulator n=1 Tax=Azospirillum rugosum TaxID=416170 RepID=A0ABS4SU15_9PROT|nr:LysR family transcriptional regulator [Azospirillum rugosum]MBP2296051.1 DNA-binding transcriptional LysR family regulator [Azospirillum rugosum]MDQ0529641.1 DNA-binding transcriptional LysR family regulator [Azospirillum rugosum]
MDQLLAIRAFVRIAEAGSFAKAADSLNLPRSTVSKLVQDLEHHLGTRLVQRTTRAVTVTPEGAAYHERAVRLLGELEDMDATAAHARALPRGRLRVDIGSSLANLVLIPALPDFRGRYPDVQLFLGVNDRPVDLIGEGVDCVIRGGALADSSLVARRLCELDYVTCAAPSYIEAHGIPAHPAEIEAGHAVCSYCSALTGKVFPLHFQRGEERHEIAGPSVVGVNESTAHVTALLAGLGIGQTFGFVARPFLEDGRLVRILPDWTQSPHPLQLVYPANRHPSAKLRVFSEWVAELFGRIDHRAG